MFDWGNWVIQTIIAAFFISGFVVFYNQGLTAATQTHRERWLILVRYDRLIATIFTLAMVAFCQLAQYLNPINESAYTNWALYILFIPLLDQKVRLSEYLSRSVIAMAFWAANNNLNSVNFYVSVAFLIIILVLIYTYRYVINGNWLLRMELVLWIGLDFWLSQTQLTTLSVTMSIVMFLLMNMFTAFYWSTERVTELEHHRLEQQVNLDTLTQAGSFFAFRSDSVTKFALARQKKQPMSLLMFDIDYFKNVNDTYGHATGNRVLSEIGKLVLTELKQVAELEPTFYRTGGEEFNVIFMADIAEVIPFVQTLQEHVKMAYFSYEEVTVHITLSLGLTALSGEDETFETVYERADAYLYQSKQNGRDQLTVEGQVKH